MGKLAKVMRWASIFAVGGEFGLHARERGVHVLQRLEHVDVPIEKQIDFGGAAAGDGANIL